MGKYRAAMSVGTHLFGTVRVYNDSDPVVQHRVKLGMLVRVDAPVPVEGVVEVVESAEPQPKKVGRKAAVRKKAAAVLPEPEPVVEVEGLVEVEPVVEPEPEPVEVEVPKSSVMTSWTIG